MIHTIFDWKRDFGIGTINRTGRRIKQMPDWMMTSFQNIQNRQYCCRYRHGFRLNSAPRLSRQMKNNSGCSISKRLDRPVRSAKSIFTKWKLDWLPSKAKRPSFKDDGHNRRSDCPNQQSGIGEILGTKAHSQMKLINPAAPVTRMVFLS